ncbi:protein of unknown function [Nitrosotalea devaniterrae]|uniref:Uncharacterized protein n=1 Tax=Nitrosotalea devaniterrae TaxID=1078905 RepID=A0A128A108_9ARCH|nr:protein of unknown function [Candidatus Nitrosotalea devanaterra]
MKFPFDIQRIDIKLKRALEGNRTPVRGSTVPYTNHYTTRAT